MSTQRTKLTSIIIILCFAYACSFTQNVEVGNEPAPSAIPQTSAAAVSPSVEPAVLSSPTTPADTISPVPTPVAPETSIPSVTGTPVEAAVPTKPSVPEIVGAFSVSEMPNNKGGGVGTMLVLPGQIWTGTMFSGLQEWDPRTGQLIRTISSIQPKVYFDLKTDGNQLWVLAGENEYTKADSLYVISLPGAELLKRFDITGVDQYGWEPIRLGISPGKVWVNDMTIDTATLQDIHYEAGLPSDAEFAYDGEGKMWATGSWCDGCGHDLWIIDINDPTVHNDSQHSGMLDVNTLSSPMVLTNGKMWLCQTEGVSTVNLYLVAYDIHNPVDPVFYVDITNDVEDINSANLIAASSQAVWINSEGSLLYYSLDDGRFLGSVPISDDRINSLGFDGTFLWALSSDAGLIKIAIP